MLVEVSRLKLGLNIVVSFRGFSNACLNLLCSLVSMLQNTFSPTPFRALLSFNFINLIVI